MRFPHLLRILLYAAALSTVVTHAQAVDVTTRYPWIGKSASRLTQAQCKAAMRHDGSYWWSGGKCHRKFVRYGWGIATREVAAKQNPAAMLNQGDLLMAITQYWPGEGTYCEKGGYCYPAKDIKLLGSTIIRRNLHAPATAEDTEAMHEVTSSCELMLADRKAIHAANAQDMLEGCR